MLVHFDDGSVFVLMTCRAENLQICVQFIPEPKIIEVVDLQVSTIWALGAFAASRLDFGFSSPLPPRRAEVSLVGRWLAVHGIGLNAFQP